MATSARSEVLIVEDELLTRMAAVDAIYDAGIVAHEAADATEALQAIEDHPAIKVMFTDVNMPGDMDGIELASRVCAADPGMSLVVTSGAVNLDDEQLPDSGTFLRKPYSPKRLLELVARKLIEKPD
jgi:CheY-like chemotaxis protein